MLGVVKLGKTENFIKRLWTYQRERFPIFIMLFTSISVIFSSAAVALPSNLNLLDKIPFLILAIILSILFMFHLRVVDEHRDYFFDSKYHPDRPVQKGIVSLKELMVLNSISLIIQVLLVLNLSLKSNFLWLLAFAYTIISGKDFFLGNKIKKKFLIYNSLNLIQLLIFQFFLYSIFNPNFNFFNLVLFLHFVFAVMNVALLEFARKMKSSKNESKVGDTYSFRFGKSGASLVYIVMAIISFTLFSFGLFKLNPSLNYFFLGFFILNLIIVSVITYLIYDNKKSELFIQGAGALFYISTHLLLALSRI